MDNNKIDITKMAAQQCGGGHDEGGCGCGKEKTKDGFDQVLEKSQSRRGALKSLTAGLLAGTGLVNTSCSILGLSLIHI